MASDLSHAEREEIRAGIERGESARSIAELIDRDHSTICRELGRNGGRHAYRAQTAQQRADTFRRRPKIPKLIANPELAAEVLQRLHALDSPMRISIELGQQGHSISHETIYQAVYEPNSGLGLTNTTAHCLHLKRSQRKHRHTPTNTTKFHPLGAFNLIAKRPPQANNRTEVGHFEGDLIAGAYNRSAIITMFDRATRHLWLATTNGKTADGTHNGLINIFKRIPPTIRRTLTWDQGTEMARHHETAQTCGIDIYFAEPKSPWQRPTNENGNALVRRYVGKQTNLNHYTPTDLRHIEQRINTIPRRTLNWHTAQHKYNQAVALTT